MLQNNRIRSPWVVGFVALAFNLHSPSGHEMVYNSLLKIKFVNEWAQAEVILGRSIPFSEFRKDAEIWAYHPDPDIHTQRVSLLTKPSLCFPAPNGDDPDQPQTQLACHSSIRESKKNKNGLALA